MRVIIVGLGICVNALGNWGGGGESGKVGRGGSGRRDVLTPVSLFPVSGLPVFRFIVLFFEPYYEHMAVAPAEQHSGHISFLNFLKDLVVFVIPLDFSMVNFD